MRRRPLLFPLLAACSAIALLVSACGDHRPASITKPTAEGGVAGGTPGRGATVLICHEGDNGERSIISVNEHAWPAHQAHGDAMVVDADGDGYVAGENFCMPDGDCNDNDASIHPGAQEQCDGVDGNCNGLQDESMEPLGTQSGDILRDLNRLSESAMGNLVADAMRANYVDAEAAITNSGGLRADLIYNGSVQGGSNGEIVCIELFAILPFGNQAVLLTLTGAQLEQLFVSGFVVSCNAGAGVSTGRFPQVSGLKVEYACNSLTPTIVGMWKTPNGIGGTHIPIGPTDTIRIVTNDFMANGGDGYVVLQQATNVVQTNNTLLKALTEYVMSHPGLTASVEGRIVKSQPQ